MNYQQLEDEVVRDTMSQLENIDRRALIGRIVDSEEMEEEYRAVLRRSLRQVAEQTTQALEVETRNVPQSTFASPIDEYMFHESNGHNTAIAEIEAKKKEFFNAKEV